MKGWWPLLHLCLYLVIHFGQNIVNGKSVLSDETKDEAFVYLTQFGYIEKDSENSNLVTDKVITNAIKDFQVCNFTYLVPFDCSNSSKYSFLFEIERNLLA